MGKSEEELLRLPPIPEGFKLVTPEKPIIPETPFGLPVIPEGFKLVIPPDMPVAPDLAEKLRPPRIIPTKELPVMPEFAPPPTEAELRQPAKLDIGQIVKDTLSGALRDLAGSLTPLAGTAEAAMTVASGIPGYLIGVSAQAGKGIWDWLTEGFRWKDQKPEISKDLATEILKSIGKNENFKDKVATFFTHMPRTEEGEFFAQVATAPFEMFFAGVDEVAKLMTDDPEIQQGIRFLGDIALIFGLPMAKRAFHRAKTTGRPLNLDEVFNEIKESKAVPESVKKNAREVFWKAEGKEALEIMARKERAEKFRPPTAEEVAEEAMIRTEIYKPLARPEYKEPAKIVKEYPEWYIEKQKKILAEEGRVRAHMEGKSVAEIAEIRKSLPVEEQIIVDKLTMAKALERPKPGTIAFELNKEANELNPGPSQTILVHSYNIARTIGEANAKKIGIEKIKDIGRDIQAERINAQEGIDMARRMVEKSTEIRPEKPVEPRPPIEEEVIPPEVKPPTEKPIVEFGAETVETISDLSRRAEKHIEFEDFRASLEKRGQLADAESIIKRSPYKSLEELWKSEEKIPEFKVKEEWKVEKSKEEQARIAEKRAEEALGEIEEGFEYIKTSEEIAEEVRAKLKYEGPKAGLAIKPTEAFPVKEKPFKFDPEIESRFEAAKGIKKVTIPEKARNVLVSAKNKITRTYEHLPNTAEFIELKTSLKTLAKQGGVSSDKAIRTMQGITIRLNKPTQDLFRRKVILDDLAREAEAGHDLPFGFTKDTLKTEKARLDSVVGTRPELLDAIKKRNRLFDSIKNDYVYWAKKAGVDLESKLTKEDYFRHQVLQYARDKGISHTGKRLRVPRKREFLKERKGSEFDINTDYFEAEYEVMAQMLYDIEIYKTINRIRPYSIHEKVRADAKKQGLENWHDAIPEGYVAWQPKEGNIFYMADTIPARIAEQILDGALNDMGVVREKLTKSLSMGRKRMEWVVKENVAKTLNDLTQRTPPSWLTRLSKNALRLWKVWTLISPRRLLKYNIRNLTGDADAAFVGNPSGFKKVPKAVEGLMDVFSADKPMPKEMRQWFDRGGMETTLQAQELGDIKTLRLFQKFYEQRGGVEKIPAKVWKKYWKTARLSTDFREAILRYANYLDYLEQIQKSPEGRPKNFGASIPEEIMALKDPRDKAFRLSNELLGAYDEISVFGQALRNHVYPFWSWKELNFRRYIRLFKNAAKDNGVASTVGRKLLTTGLKTPYMALRVGKFAMKATAFSCLLQVWNHTMFPEEEKMLPKEIKGRAHIILGRDEKGEILYFTRLGALTDFLEWFGLDAAPNLVSSFLSGKKSMKDVATEMAKAPVNQVVQGLSPFYKIPFELATRRSLFPDTFEPRTIRDRGLHIARGLALENEYKAIMGKPGEPYLETLPLSAIYKSNPLEAAYHEIYDMESDFLKKLGKKGEGFWLTPRGSTLYDMKLAHRHGDKKAERKALNAYIQYHLIEYAETGKSEKETLVSISQGIKTSLKNMEPLSSLNIKEKVAFVKSLNEEEIEILLKAIRFYSETLAGTTPLEEKE